MSFMLSSMTASVPTLFQKKKSIFPSMACQMRAKTVPILFAKSKRFLPQLKSPWVHGFGPWQCSFQSQSRANFQLKKRGPHCYFQSLFRANFELLLARFRLLVESSRSWGGACGARNLEGHSSRDAESDRDCIEAQRTLARALRVLEHRARNFNASAPWLLQGIDNQPTAGSASFNASAG